MSIFFSVFHSFGRIAQLVAHSLHKREVPGSSARHYTWQSFSSFLNSVWWYSARMWFYISFHSLSLSFFSNWGKLDVPITFHANFCSFLSSMSLNPLIYQPHSNFQQGAAMFTASWVQLRLELLVCDRSVSVNVITHTFVGLKCLTETKIQILCDHVDHTSFYIVEMGYLMVQLLSAHIVGPTKFINLTTALGAGWTTTQCFIKH